jgi:predicted Zn-dependent peptidase
VSNLARQELYFNEFMSPDELIERVEAVTRDQIQKIAREFFQTEHIALAMLGRLSEIEITRNDLAC